MPRLFLIYRAGDGYRWQLVTADRRVIAVANEACESEAKCRDAVQIVKDSMAAQVRLVRALAATS
jgi:uncharacterized protein YegP (UPF0339 family)